MIYKNTMQNKNILNRIINFYRFNSDYYVKIIHYPLSIIN